MFFAHRAHTVYQAPLYDSAGRRIVVAIVWSTLCRHLRTMLL